MTFYNRKTPRAQRYDYTSNWTYFVTICTKNRDNYFGKIENERMILSEIWKICENELKNTLKKRPDIEIYNYAIMPNHIHILIYKWQKSHSLWSVIWWFKSAVSKSCKENNIEFERQSRFHDKIVRDEYSYDVINKYIEDNPKNRWKDKFYTH